MPFRIKDLIQTASSSYIFKKMGMDDLVYKIYYVRIFIELCLLLEK